MKRIPGWLRLCVVVMPFAAAFYLAAPAFAADIIADWPGLQMPPPPQLKPVTVDPKTTALFLFDFMNTNCNTQDRPRCVEAVPKLKALMDKARAAGMLVAYTLPGGGKSVDPGIAPHDGEVVDQKQGGPDKFIGSDLDQPLKDRGIKTVILCGTSAQGVGTGAGAAQRGYYVAYPVDCILRHRLAGS